MEVAWEHETKGAMIRSKERWIQEGEKSTKYFLNLEKKRNVVNKTITSLRTNDGNVITNQEELSKEQVKYEGHSKSSTCWIIALLWKMVRI